MKKTAAILVLFWVSMQSQDYSDFRRRYDHMNENDQAAFQYIVPYIAKAKRERNYQELTQAYKDAASFSENYKLVYADSMLATAYQSGDPDLQAAAHITKGTIYYFTYRKFQPALDEYLKGWRFAQNSKDRYLHHKNLYHIGLVKSYLGYYDEAVPIFTKCIAFFEEPKPGEHPNLSFNRQKGYLNSLHLAAASELGRRRFDEAAVLVDQGLKNSSAGDFYLERCHFYKLRGILASRRGDDHAAISEFTTALPGFIKKNDFSDASLVWYYRGKSLWRQGKKAEAVQDFIKVDSVFRRYHFILPPVRNAYEMLIVNSKETRDRTLELYYTTQLLKADKVLGADFKYLSGKIHREFDTKDLIEAKSSLERTLYRRHLLTWLLTVTVAGLCLLIYRKWRYERQLQIKYDGLVLKIKEQAREKQHNNAQGREKLSDDKAAELLAKIDGLEEKLFFLEKGLTLAKVAAKLKTNTSYLSHVINTYKGCTFKVYLNKLRIRYVRDRLYEDRTWRCYGVEVLAKECGYADRSKFSRAFEQETSVSPLEFIRKRREELRLPISSEEVPSAAE